MVEKNYMLTVIRLRKKSTEFAPIGKKIKFTDQKLFTKNKSNKSVFNDQAPFHLMMYQFQYPYLAKYNLMHHYYVFIIVVSCCVHKGEEADNMPANHSIKNLK